MRQVGQRSGGPVSKARRRLGEQGGSGHAKLARGCKLEAIGQSLAHT